MGELPAFKDRQGRFDIAVWSPKEGKNGMMSLQRSRKDASTDQYVRETIRFFPDELDNLGEVLVKAKEYMTKNGMYPPKPRPQQ